MTRLPAVGLTVVVAILGCGKSNKSQTITLGAVLSETGSRATYGNASLQSIQMATDEINAAGGINGATLSFQVRDDKSDPATALTGTQDLVNNFHVPAIVGYSQNDVALPSLGVTVDAGVVMISDLAQGPPFTPASTNGFFFSTSSSFTEEGTILAERAAGKGFKKAAIIASPQALGQLFAASFTAKFTALGGTVTSNITITEGQSSYASVLQQTYGAGVPDCILGATFNADEAQIIKDYLSGFAANQTFWFFTPVQNIPDFPTAVGPSNFTFKHEGVDSNNGPGIMTFFTAWQAKYPNNTLEPEPGVYDDVYVVALALLQANKTDGASIKAAVPLVTSPSATSPTSIGPGDFGKAVTAVQAGTAIDYEGASSPCDFDQNGQAALTYLIWQYDTSGNSNTIVPSITP